MLYINHSGKYIEINFFNMKIPFLAIFVGFGKMPVKKKKKKKKNALWWQSAIVHICGLLYINKNN